MKRFFQNKMPVISAAIILLLACIVLLIVFTGSDPLSSAPTGSATGNSGLTVYFFPVGKADAMLLKTENAAVMIDTGEKDDAKDLIADLEELGVERLDYLIITHFDRDHVGAAAKLIDRFTVATILQSNCPQDNTAYRKYTSALSMHAGITAVTVTGDMTFTLDGMQFTVYAPAASYPEDESNNSSLVVTMAYGSRRLLFMGDAGEQRTQELMNRGLSACDFIKMQHHGSYDPLLPAFLNIIRPSYAVITCSDKEPEDSRTVSVLETLGAQVCLTRNGLCILRCDGQDITLKYGELP